MHPVLTSLEPSVPRLMTLHAKALGTITGLRVKKITLLRGPSSNRSTEQQSLTL